jgi:hypothetical protein
LNEPETERIVKNRGKSKSSHEESWRSLPLSRTGVAPFRLVSDATPRLLLLPAMVLGAALVIWKRKLEVGKDLKAKGLVKSWGHLRFYL